MRRAAERVDDQMTAYMQTRAIPGPWPAAEHLLVCISPSTLGERLVRSTRRLADELNAEWLALYVETPDHLHLPLEKRDQVARTLRLAEELGARSLILPVSSAAPSIAGTVMEYARKHNITKVIAGKPLRPRWKDFLRGSIVDQLIHHSGNIDIYVISSAPDGHLPAEEAAWRPHRPWRRYLYSLALVAVATGLGALISQEISPANLVMIYLLAVVIAALYLGRGPAILAAIASVLAFDFFFVPPQLTFAVTDTEYLLTFAGLLGVGLVISYLTVRTRDQAEAAQKREADTATLYALSRDLAAASGLEAALKAVIVHMDEAFGRDTVVFLPEGEDSLGPYGRGTDYLLDEVETTAASWAFQHGEPAGRHTNTLPAAQARYIPLKASERIVGVLGVKPKDKSVQLTPDQRRLLEAFASQSALAIERVQLAEQAGKIKLLQTAEKLQNSLLNSISHDLRTPLVSITGALTTLEEQKNSIDDTARDSLVETAREEADRLNRLVGNLLDMTRVEAGALNLAIEPSDIQDLIGAALAQVDNRLASRPVQVDIPPDFPMVPMDFVLIVQVLANLLDNALKYSPDGSPLEIRADLVDTEARISVMDHGIGIPPEDLERVFDKFYRVQRPDHVSGTGLGLSISKGIIEAHNGRIWAANRPGGGAIITLTLPLGTKINK
jgi:two-component system sensor histidine kinase KdpD